MCQRTSVVVFATACLLSVSLIEAYSTLTPHISTSSSRRHAFSTPVFDENWYDMSGCLVLLPKNERLPRSVVHFIGGFLVGSAPSIGYNYMLQELASKGHLVVASPLPVSLNHQEVARAIQDSFNKCYSSDISRILGSAVTDVPVIGLSHSLGGKIRILIESSSSSVRSTEDRKSATCANVYLAFNNYDAKQSLDLMGSVLSNASPEMKKVVESPEVQRVLALTRKNPISNIRSALGTSPSSFGPAATLFSDVIKESIGDILDDVDDRLSSLFNDYEFRPSASETWSMFDRAYANPSNVIFQFEDDQIDQSKELQTRLEGSTYSPLLLRVKGGHGTPCAVSADSAATLEFNKILGVQIGKLADDNWGKGAGAGNRGRLYLPDGTKWDSDD